MSKVLQYDATNALVLRKHPSALAIPFFKASIPAFIGIIFLFHVESKILSWAGLAVVFLALSYALYEFIIWYYDIIIINKEKVMVIKQKSLFSREIKEAPINRISNMIVKTSGMLSTLFGFGSVVVTSTSGELVLQDLKNPVGVKRTIEGLQKKGSITASELIEYIVKAKQELD